MIKARCLNCYFTRVFARYFLYTLSLAYGFLFLVSLIETYDKFAHSAFLGWNVLLLALYITPDMLQTAMPLVILISAIYYFIYLGKSQQLMIAQQAGITLHSLMIMPVVCVCIIALCSLALLNPLAATLLEKHENFENQQRERTASLLSVADTGIWLRQSFEDTSLIIHALSWQHDAQRFVDVSIWQYYQDDFMQRIEAETADIVASEWTLNNVIRYSPVAGSQQLDSLSLTTHIDQEKINDSFTSASTISVWKLAEFISIIENAGLSADGHIVHFHQLLAQPLIFIAMFFLTGGICVGINQRTPAKKQVLIALGIGVGYFIFSRTFYTFGTRYQWPVLFSIWLPMILFLISTLLYTISRETRATS